MQFHTKPFRLHQTFLKKGEGGGMRMKREGGMEGSLVELGEKRMRIADREFINQVICTEKLKH